MKRLRWLFWLLVIIFIWIIVSRFADLKSLAQTLAIGKWQWVLFAAFLQFIYYIIYTSVYKASFDTVEVKSRTRDMVPIMFASVFMNVVAPSGGASGSALFVDDARRRGESAVRAAAGTLLALVAEFSTFVIFLIAGIFYLFVFHDLKIYEVISAILLLVMVVGMAGILLLGIWQPNLLERILKWLRRIINWIGKLIKRDQILPESWVADIADEYANASVAIATHPQQLAKTMGLAFCMHFVDIASLYVLFLAFHQHVGPGILIAGYAMGMLFWIITITPQGVGIVEGMMALVFTSLGVPAARATVIALSFRGLTFWLPLLIGFVLLRSLRTFNPKARPISSAWALRSVFLLTAAMGLLNIYTAVTPSISEHARNIIQLFPLVVFHGGRLTSALTGMALIFLASSLGRRKRIAWILALTILVLSALNHMIKDHAYEVSIFAMMLTAWLIYLRPHFHARSDPPSIRQGIVALISATIFTLFYGSIGFYLLDHHYKVNFDLGTAVRQTIMMFTQFYNPGLEPITGFGRYFAVSIYIIGVVSFAYAVIMLIRPVLLRQPVTANEKQIAKEIVETYGRTTLAAFALLDDKRYYFSPGGSLIQFVVEGRVALTLGDPIGPEKDVRDAIRGFQAYCRRNDWLAAFYQVLPDHLDIYLQENFNQLAIGQEGIVNLSTFSLEGKENKNIRNTYNKLVRLGYSTETQTPPPSKHMLNELKEISDSWLTMMNATEKRFSIGWFDEDYISRCPVMTVMDQYGQRIAFTNILSEYKRNECTIDLMRHRPEAENGTMDFLFISLFYWAKEQGYDTFNLGLSSLSGVGAEPSDPAIERAMHYVYEHINQFYNFKGLHKFKDKFHPEWSTRYLIYPDLVNLPLIILAMIRADSGNTLLSSYIRPRK